MIRRAWLAAAAVLLLVLVACGGDSDASPTATPDAAEFARQTFVTWCGPCHGAGGEGFVNALNAPALDSSGEAHLLSDDAIMAAIIDGGAASGGVMAPLGDSMTDEQKAAALEYVHMLWSDEQHALHYDDGGHSDSSP